MKVRKLISIPIKSLAGIQKAYEDYTQLFIGPNSLHAPLWGSVYLDRKHSLFKEQTLQYT
ncbi:molecular chaperone TorD family protein [Bacillus siamensis]|uniref:Uncharacterized protein n=1 Tax=Bacillus siamensis TaxID=659243 RepID=A0AAI8HRG9_9BACI|nr:hypothetical protein CWD84_19330 [Bacillus siamensis]